jgi:hypothetical protein
MESSPKLLIASFLLWFLMVIPSKTLGQKMMLISDELHANAEKFQVGTKGGPGKLKYHYGPYRVTKAKVGWAKRKYKSKLFSPLEKASSERNLSFEFVSDIGDTARVNLSRYINYEGIYDVGVTFFSENSSITSEINENVLENSDNLFGGIETNSRNQAWNFVVRMNYGINVEDRAIFAGLLSDGERMIDILPVFHYQNPGEKNTADMMFDSEIWHKGFEFVENGLPIGAVQIGPWKKMSVVWFSKKNDPMTNFIIGSTYAALLREYRIDF